MSTKEILKYRNIWMAFAILWIVLFHSGISFSNPVLNYIKEFGYGGVDIFLFASGIGCFYSFMKNENILEFLKRRFWKIMPTYWCFMLIWLLYKVWRGNMPFNAIIGNLFCIQNFTGNGNCFNWYISAMWLFYIITPMMAKIVEKVNSWKKGLLWIILLLVFSISFWNSSAFIIIISRIPIFFLGMYFASVFQKKEIISKKIIIILMILMICGVILLLGFYTMFPKKLWDYALWWYPFILIVPGMCIGISIISDFVNRLKLGRKIDNLFCIIGSNTFEIYLIHIFLFQIGTEILFPNNIVQNCNLNKFIMILLLIPLTIAFKYYCKLIKWICNKIKDRYIKNKKGRIHVYR